MILVIVISAVELSIKVVVVVVAAVAAAVYSNTVHGTAHEMREMSVWDREDATSTRHNAVEYCMRYILLEIIFEHTNSMLLIGIELHILESI